MPETLFKFKQFEMVQEQSAMKINTDGVLLGAWAEVDGKKRILDIGTGCGVIAIMLAQRSSDPTVIGVEIDEDSYTEAKSNMEESPWKKRLEVINESIQDYSTKYSGEFDLIVSNPPFFSGGTLSATQEKSMVRHTTKLSHNDLLRSAFKLLSEEGDFSVILPHLEGLRFVELAEQYRLYCTKMTEVKSFPDSATERLLLNFRKEKGSLTEDVITIRDQEKNFSSGYKQLTKEFYLKF